MVPCKLVGTVKRFVRPIGHPGFQLLHNCFCYFDVRFTFFNANTGFKKLLVIPI